MSSTFSQQLDALSAWRRALEGQVKGLARHLSENDLDRDGAGVKNLLTLAARLSSDRLTVAFVAEFSRGKSELINAIFFGDTGQRVLPATPGRTTMCPVEIGFDAGEPPQLSLLPIETRLETTTLAEWRLHDQRWKRLRLDPAAPAKLTETLAEVMRTKAVTVARARDLGLWHDDRPDDNPPVMGDGLVEIPTWRHAVINYPHPLLRRGLVVLDTPGLNAIGAEPELTLSLLPSAHATVFILGADTGVTKSDLAVWREHLSAPGITRFVALNKIDTLVDPLLTPSQVALQIESQRQSTAQQLGIDASHVFPVSARQALTGAIEGRRDLFDASCLASLETALGEQLLPRRHASLNESVKMVLQALELTTGRAMQDTRRQTAEQLIELRGLRGKNSGKTSLMARRVAQEATEFERGATKATAVRSIHVRMLRSQLVALASSALRDDFEQLQRAMDDSFLSLGAKRAFAALFERVRARVSDAQRHGQEAHEMLQASFKQLNAEFGFALSLDAPPTLETAREAIDQLETNYAQYLGVSNAWRLSDKRFTDQFRRMLMAKLSVILEEASSNVEAWHKAASSILDSQLRDRRASYQRRSEALERIAGAHDELEGRIRQLEEQERRSLALAQRTLSLLVELRRAAAAMPRSPEADAGATRAGSGRDDVRTVPGGFDVRPSVPEGFHVDSHTRAVHVDTTLEPVLAR